MDTLLYEVRDETAYITLNRPEVLNALNSTVYGELAEILDSINCQHGVRVVILTGAGDRAFAAGADIAAMRNYTAQQARAFARLALCAVELISFLPQPVIAAVNGLALGGGCELAMACDLRIASTRAKFGQPEITLGIIPGGGGTQRLPRLAGIARAKHLIFTGAIITAQEALAAGLVNQVVEPDDLLPAAGRLSAALREKPAQALALAKAAVNQAMELPLGAGLDYEIECFGECFATDDQKEGMTAFLEKRPPKFQGR